MLSGRLSIRFFHCPHGSSVVFQVLYVIKRMKGHKNKDLSNRFKPGDACASPPSLCFGFLKKNKKIKKSDKSAGIQLPPVWRSAVSASTQKRWRDRTVGGMIRSGRLHDVNILGKITKSDLFNVKRVMKPNHCAQSNLHLNSVLVLADTKRASIITWK